MERIQLSCVRMRSAAGDVGLLLADTLVVSESVADVHARLAHVDELGRTPRRLVEISQGGGVVSQCGVCGTTREVRPAHVWSVGDHVHTIGQRVACTSDLDPGERPTPIELRVVRLRGDRVIEIGQGPRVLPTSTQRQPTQVSKIGPVFQHDRSVEVGECTCGVALIDAERGSGLEVTCTVRCQPDGTIDVCTPLRQGRAILIASKKRQIRVLCVVLAKHENTRDDTRRDAEQDRQANQLAAEGHACLTSWSC